MVLLNYQKLKESVKIRFGDDSKIDFSMEERQLKNLLNSYVGAGMDKIIISKLKITDKVRRGEFKEVIRPFVL